MSRRPSSSNPDAVALALSLPQFGGAFRWLITKGVTSARIASLFGTTSGNVRLIASRAEGQEPAPEFHPQLRLQPTPEQRLALQVRADYGGGGVSGKQRKKLAALAEEVGVIVGIHRMQYSYAEGVAALRQILPLVGYPSDARRIALLAEIHHHIAWFQTHRGFSSSSVRARKKPWGCGWSPFMKLGIGSISGATLKRLWFAPTPIRSDESRRRLSARWTWLPKQHRFSASRSVPTTFGNEALRAFNSARTRRPKSTSRTPWKSCSGSAKDRRPYPR